MKKWKKRTVAFLILLFALPQTFGSVMAASGTWKKDGRGYWYSYADGTYAKSSWLEDGGKWYYFRANGYMAKGWLKLGGKWYYFGKDGAMVTGSMTIDGTSYTFDQNGVMVSEGSGSTGGKVGSIVTFGKYEQDNNSSNGKEAIEWLVLDEKSDGSLFVVSRYAIERQSYNAGYVDMTWENCALRKWLNSTFLNAAFTSAEQAKILQTTVVNEDNPFTGVKGGNTTKDKVFLLSIGEVQKYFGASKLSTQGYTINEKAPCKATAYAKANNAMTYDLSSIAYASDLKQFSGNCWYWLRSPGGNARRAAYVNNLGEAGYASFYIYNTDCSVRPAMWIKP